MNRHIKETRTVLHHVKTHTHKKQIQDKKFLNEHENKGMLLQELDV